MKSIAQLCPLQVYNYYSDSLLLLTLLFTFILSSFSLYFLYIYFLHIKNKLYILSFHLIIFFLFSSFTFVTVQDETELVKRITTNSTTTDKKADKSKCILHIIFSFFSSATFYFLSCFFFFIIYLYIYIFFPTGRCTCGYYTGLDTQAKTPTEREQSCGWWGRGKRFALYTVDLLLINR